MRPHAALLLSAAIALSVVPLTAGAASGTGLPRAMPPASVFVPWLDGTRMRIGYRAGSTLASSVLLTRTSDGQAPLVRTLPADRTEFTETGLEVGRTYTYEVRAVGAGGVQSVAVRRSAVATGRPQFGADGVTTASTTTAPFRVRLSAAGSSARTSFTAFGYRLPPGSNTFNEPSDVRIPWLDGARGSSFVFGGPAAPGARATTSIPGSTYRFAGFAVDEFGNRTLGSASGRSAVPFDQTHATLAGGAVSAHRPGAYAGSAAVLPRAGASASFRVKGERVVVVGERCLTCGAFDVLLDGRRVARVDTRAGTRQVRQPLWARTFVVERTVALTVRAVGTRGRAAVYADALGVIRTDGRFRRGQFLSMTRGTTVSSPNDRFRVSYQRDGNVVVRPVGGRPTFTTGTAGSVTATSPRQVGSFGVEPSCRLVLRGDRNRAFFEAGSSCAPATEPGFFYLSASLVMQNDGNLVLYRFNDGRPLWSSKTGLL